MKKVYSNSFVLENVTICKTVLQEYYLRLNPYEWTIWSKCFGKVLLINGTSSSGKTTVCKYLSKFGFNSINIDEVADEVIFGYFGKFTENIFLVKKFLTNDDMTRILNGYKVKEVNYSESQLTIIKTLQDEINHILKHSLPNKMEIYDQVYEKAKKYIFSGQDVVIDIVAKDESVNMLSYCFNYYPMLIALLYSSLEENLIKCFKRNCASAETGTADYRYPALIVDQYNSFYTFISKNNVSKKDNIIEMVDKDKTLAILKMAKWFDYNLFLYVKEIRYSEKGYYHSRISDADVIQGMQNKVKTIENNMMLDNVQEVYTLPKVKCNFVLKSPFLKYINDLILILGDDNYDQTTLPTIIGNSGLMVESEYGEPIIEFGSSFRL
jgi:hypothetical protein